MKKIILTSVLFIASLLSSQENAILFLGDSLTEGLGVSRDKNYVSLVAKKMNEIDKQAIVINGGVSGSTTSDGLARLRWYMKKKPNIVFVALGANDGLRGLDLSASQKNLEEIIEFAQKSGAKVLLAGMLLPPNYGAQYTNHFRDMYAALQTKYGLKMMPFLLKNVAGVESLNQADGIHPNEKGHRIISENVFAFIKDAL